MVVDTLTVKLPYIDYHAQLVAVCQTCYEHGINGIRKTWNLPALVVGVHSMQKSSMDY